MTSGFEQILKGTVSRYPKLLFLIAFILYFNIAGCGIKAPPAVPGITNNYAGVDDLRSKITVDRLILTWTIDQTSLNSSLAGFYVYRSKEKMTDSRCKGCPALFERIADVRVEPEDLAKGGAEMRFEETIEKGFSYIYKIVDHDRKGVKGGNSNFVKFLF